jgi:hypothetical protein
VSSPSCIYQHEILLISFTICDFLVTLHEHACSDAAELLRQLGSGLTLFSSYSERCSTQNSTRCWTELALENPNGRCVPFPIPIKNLTDM